MRKIIPYILFVLIGILFSVMYANTFRGHLINQHLWDQGPFAFEGAGYELFARENVFATTDHPSLIRHIFCGLLYPKIYKLLILFFPVYDSPLVCSFLGGLAIALFGFWLCWHTKGSPIVFPILLLMGFSFTPWFISSVWESQAFIFLGGVVLLIFLDKLIRRPCLLNVFLIIAATLFMLLISLGNLYNLALVPFALLVRVKRVGLKKVVAWSSIYLCSTLILIILIYQAVGFFINPMLKLYDGAHHGGVVPFCRQQSKMVSSWARFKDVPTIQNNVFQVLLYSIGGLKLPAGAEVYGPEGRTPCRNEWRKSDAYLSYFRDLSGLFFLTCYAALLLIILITFFRKKIWAEEPLLLVVAFWFLLFITIWIYTCPIGGAPQAAELPPALWAFFALVLVRLKPRKIILFLCIFLFSIIWNNWEVFQYFKESYVRFHFTPPSPPIMAFKSFGEGNLLFSDGIVVTSDSHSPDDESVDRLIDNDPETYWQVAPEKVDQPTWVLFDFGEGNREIVRCLAACPRENFPSQFFRNAKILGSNDGESWEKIAHIVQKDVPKNNFWKEWFFDNEQAFRYYKLYISDGHEGENHAFRSMAELALFRGNLLYSEEVVMTVDSRQHSSRGADKLIDNNPETFWHVAPEKVGQPTWVIVDFGEGNLKTVRSLAGRPLKNISFQFFHYADLLGSNDGKSWEKIAHFFLREVPTDDKWRKWSFDNNQAFRYYKLSIPYQGGGNRFWSMTELWMSE